MNIFINILISIWIIGILYLLYNEKEKIKAKDILILIAWPILALVITYIYFKHKDLFLELLKDYYNKV